jgi:hypothetical protein
VIALLSEGSATSRRGQDAASGTPPRPARDHLLVSSIASTNGEPAAAAARTTGGVTVPGPKGARVSLDGLPRGAAPLSITDLAPGGHDVRVTTNSAVASGRVVVAPGSVATFVVSTPAQRSPTVTAAPSRPVQVQEPVAALGAVSVALPFDVQIYEGGRFAGTNAAELMLPPGAHRLELVNQSLNYRAVESVQVQSGKAVKIPAAPPVGSVSLNALPWAEVFVDGRSLGETPLGQVPMAVGVHEVVFRHPQFGEQSRSITVGAGGSTRISVDLRK